MLGYSVHSQDREEPDDGYDITVMLNQWDALSTNFWFCPVKAGLPTGHHLALVEPADNDQQ
jgi:hypothetical protein